jgi:ABC-2 type transport system permease protein
MNAISRYLRLWLAFGRYGLVRELTFRTNFLVKLFVEILWLALLLVFYETVFVQTDLVADWSREEYLFFVGCYFALGGLMELFFLENCNQFADLVRTGDLDFYLLRPVDEQFLVTCRNIDWSCAANVLMGIGVMLVALSSLGWPFTFFQAASFLVMFLCGLALCYSFLLLLTSASVWFMRNQSLFEVWWLFTTLMRYPREIFRSWWAAPMAWFFSFVVPIMLVTNIPASLMLDRALDPRTVLYAVFATGLMLYLSRRFFMHALSRYRSASS